MAPTGATSTLLWLGLACLFGFICCQEKTVLTPPYFNIAEKRKVTVNATCGEGVAQKEVYCKLVGYDRLDSGITFDILDGQICDYCYPPSANETSDKTHPGQNVVDGDISTWWQSPPISRGLKYNRVTLGIDLVQTFQVAYVVVTMANSPRPGVWALERSVDHQQTWQPWQYFAGNDAECQKYFGLHADEKITADDQVICSTEFSKVLPIEDGEIYVSLTANRPSAKDPLGSETLRRWILATNIRFRLISTKTMLGHLMSVAQGDKTVTRRYYYSIKEISVGGRCVCNGHAYVCPPSETDPDLLVCQCQHNTYGPNCEQCAPGFVQKKWRRYTRRDPYECEPCNCNGHSDKCHYDEEIDRQGLSIDIHGNRDGGGVCEECQHFTDGTNCETCIFGYFRPEGVLANATEPCIPCQCDNDHRYTGNCAPESGKCECKPAFKGAHDCSACADGYYDYPECKPCDCFANGTTLMANGLPFCVADGSSEIKCPCLENFSGQFCKECAEGFYNFPECTPCECNPTGSQNNACDRETGQCQCQRNYGARQCEECNNGFYNYPTCSTCDCDPRGTLDEVCDKSNGKCLCKDGFSGARCDQCEPGWFDYPNCTPCDCADVGSRSAICDEVTGQCQCLTNYGGRQCAECSAGNFGYPECKACGCDSLGSKGLSCDNNGACNCRQNFIGLKCDQCGPERYNYPLCEECNCNPDGVTEDFFAKGGCDSVPLGSLCTCKPNVMGRICDTCKPLFWNLQGYNPGGCEDCNCDRVGTIGALGVCDTLDGQCACKPNVEGSRLCDECKDGFFGLSANHGLGCDHCQCDVGGTDIQKGELAVCEKNSGQCRCRPGITGLRCDEIQDSYYVPTLYQYQFEIEDGYRKDGSPVRIGYDDAKFPDYSWRGYGSYSQLQEEVLLDVNIDRPSVYRVVLRYTNPNPEPYVGEVSVVKVYGEGDGQPQSHQVLLPPTGGQPQLVTVSGDKGIYASPFDLEPGTWTTSVKINNDDPSAQEVLVDYFVLLPHEYYEPSILKEDGYVPCEAGQVLPYCRHYSYPDVSAFPRTFATQASRPGGGPDVYSWSDKMEVLAELGSSKLGSIARWQPELIFPVQVNTVGKHVLAVVFFTPDKLNPNTTSEISVSAAGDPQEGTAYIFNCPYSSLCRQVVTDPQGRVAHFDFKSSSGDVILKSDSDELNLAVDSIVAIPVEEWSLDFVTPSTECIKKEGTCILPSYPDAPDQSTIVPFVASGVGSAVAPKGSNPDVSLYYVDDDTPLIDIHGRVPKPGYYVLVAQFFQPNNPEFDLKLNISFANVGEDTDMENLLANGQFHEAVLPLPNCRHNVGCRSVMKSANDPKKTHFNLNDEFFISGNKQVPKPVWLESITAIPIENYKEDYLEPERVDGGGEFARKCGQKNFYIDTEQNQECKASVISVASDFNGGALECQCDMTGSTGYECSKIGGQCPCKPNVIGRQCTRCKPGFFGYPECKQCNCPPTAQCNEETGECICAPHVTGTDDNPCSECEENTFGYDPITGCQECMCETAGTVNGNMSCSLDSGACYCKENVVGRTCDHCASGHYQYPECLQCPCDLKGTTQDICNQESSECMCKPNVEGNECDQCREGTFDLEETNPDGCKDCFCFGKTSFCSSHDGLIRQKITSMEGWSLTSFKITRTVTEAKIRQEILPNYSGELAVSFTSYPGVDLSATSLYFKAPNDYIHNQIKSYGGKFNYQITYSGYELEGAPRSPDVLLIGADVSILFHSGLRISPNVALNVSAPIDPYYWVLPSGAPIDRAKMMVVLNNLRGVYIKASYGLDKDGQARLSDVVLDSAKEFKSGENTTDTEIVTSVELCRCPDGYYGYSCEDCAIGYYRSQEGPLGPICVPCNCHGHATNCHPLTGECVTLVPSSMVRPPPSETTKRPPSGQTDAPGGGFPEYGEPDKQEDKKDDSESEDDAWKMFCHLMPKECEVDQATQTCKHNTTGPHCDKCDVGFYGDAKQGNSDDCRSCPCPLPENNFGESCDALLTLNKDDDNGAYCICKPNYVGDRCEFCGPGYYGQPETIGDYCKPCECNGNINVTDPDSCDRFSGLCQKCLEHTSGDNCEHCENWFFGDAVLRKDCQECRCNKLGTELCNHISGDCACLPGVEGEICDRCMSDHWGFESGQPGCTNCECSEASDSTQCDLTTGQCRCKNGVTGQKCDRCMAGFWNLGPNGCESCGCNTEFAIGGTCDPVTGQCACLEGVIGQNCDRCPDKWVLVVNETRTEAPEWKRPFNYEEGCFPCSSCVHDLAEATDTLNTTLSPIMVEFKGVEASYFAFKKLQYIAKDVDRLMPEIELLNPQEGSRRLAPLEQQVSNQQKIVKSLNVEYKLKVMSDLSKEARDLETMSATSVDEMANVGSEIRLVTKEMQDIADGLGSGVTPKQIETSVEVGRQWVNDMKGYDFADDRMIANEKLRAANDLATRVKTFADPVNKFKDNVTATEIRMEKLKNNLEDLRNHSDNAQQMLRVASTLNFRNSEPAVVYKLAKINAMQDASEGNNKLGVDLNNEANQFLSEAQNAFQSLQSSSDIINNEVDKYSKSDETIRTAIYDNYQFLSDARDHAQSLDNQAMRLQTTLDQAKMPAARTLQAAHTYEMIEGAVVNATDATNLAKEAAENAAAMSVGVGNKATQSKDRTQDLYQTAMNSRDTVQNELDVSLRRSLVNIEDLSNKNKVTKDAVEKITKNLDSIVNLGDVLKSNQTNADDAETLAHDALTSIDARANEIKKNMKSARVLQNNHAEMKFSIDATKTALVEVESRDRTKRDALAQLSEDDMKQRLERLRESEQRIEALKKSVSKMMVSLKKRVSDVRTTISTINKPGVMFTQESHLKLRNPPHLSQLAAHTRIRFFFNVTRHANGDGRAFLFYLGNEENTHTKTPQTFTDDYIAAEILENGRVKITIDLGAGPVEILSNQAIGYGQWHELLIDRRGYYVTVGVRTEEGAGEIIEDLITDKLLPRVDENGRPIGSVFNLHQDHSSIFVGGFPRTAKIQERVRETYMDGQIEDLEIGDFAMSLWNFEDSNRLEGSPQRNKLKEKSLQGVRFGGQGFVSVDRSDFAPIDEEFVVRLKFKPIGSNGILFLVGSPQEGNFVCVELQNKYVSYSFNLGDGTVNLESTEPCELNEWHNFEITRRGRVGSLKVDGKLIGEVNSPGGTDRLLVDNNLYFGGYPDSVTPYPDVRAANFTGCMEEVFFGQDRVELSASSERAAGVQAGCQAKVEHLATFPASSPGYIQLESTQLEGTFEITLMFKTAQERGLLFYMTDTNQFYYISLSLIRGVLQLNVFPRNEISTDRGSDKAILYNDDKWHTVTILITQTTIQLLVDDYENFKLDVQGSGELPLLDIRYNMFLGGVPEETKLVSGSVASDAPFIGCIRDVLLNEPSVIADFNAVPYHTGIQLGICVTSKARVYEEEEPEEISTPTDSSASRGKDPSQTSSKESESDGDESEQGQTFTESDLWGFPTQDVGSETFEPQTYGECKLPLSPAADPDVDRNSGLRFGTQKDTYLEFDRLLKIKNRSDFGLEFRTTVPNGIIFYIADERNSDFIALFMKDGKLVYGFNCGSGSAYITTDEKWNDGNWHFAEFGRQGNKGKLYVDGNIKGENEGIGSTKNIEVQTVFHLGGLPADKLELEIVQKNLNKVNTGFIGCLRKFRLRESEIGKWTKNHRGGVIPCSKKVEPGYFFGPAGGYLHAFKRFRVGLDFDIRMQIKPRNISGLLLAIQGRRDYLILQMVDGTMTFTVDNGRGPITAVFKPTSPFQFCDGKWHEIHAVKAKNVVTLSVDDVFAQPGIGVPGVSSTDTNHGLFIGGHPKFDRLIGRQTETNFVGCIRKIVVEGNELEIDQEMLKGDILSHVCPTI